ncbi:hypothetical protein HZS_7543 [Henneguya salminicola]|nr:hypothetical protein HZS_7543 [Henneguya salminicola]
MVDKNELGNLLWALKNGELEEVKHFISKGIDPNTKIARRALLHHAADYGQTKVIEYLLDSKADINV